jgi:hypothetical protein
MGVTELTGYDTSAMAATTMAASVVLTSRYAYTVTRINNKDCQENGRG